MDIAEAWFHLTDSWNDTPHLVDWQSYSDWLREQYQYCTPDPQPGAHEFFDCLTWYFCESTRMANLSVMPEGQGIEEYRKDIFGLFEYFYENFLRAYEEINEAYMQAIAAQQHAEQAQEFDAFGIGSEESSPLVSDEAIDKALEEFADPEGSISPDVIEQISPYVGVEFIDDDTPPNIS
ncbi:hypothetical protein [Streptomyces cinereoruber]|uniref:hypothetical protein n=1 Tax=Streptomyces cinereoruber TaxID=67260 RepID=UPI00364632E7